MWTCEDLEGRPKRRYDGIGGSVNGLCRTHSHAPDLVTAFTQREVPGLQTHGHRRP